MLLRYRQEHVLQRSHKSAMERNQNAMLIGMSDAKWSSLRRIEVKELEHFMQPFVETHVVQDPTRDTVWCSLPYGSIVNFACHGDSNVSDPSQSKLFLICKMTTLRSSPTWLVVGRNSTTIRRTLYQRYHSFSADSSKALHRSQLISYVSPSCSTSTIGGSIWSAPLWIRIGLKGA